MTLLFYILVALVLLYSIILHEIAHGKAAEVMGDGTARMYGRLTLNPWPHLDPFGTILPILLILIGSPMVFGWAKPVPINPYNFTDYRKGMLWVSAAGILTNLFVAWILAASIKFLPPADANLSYLLREALNFGVRINIVLAVFNLIPIPPLDGSQLLKTLAPDFYDSYIRPIEPFGMIILIMFITFPGTQILLGTVIEWIYNLLMLRLI
ncbi:site-2 protease family protein [Candidatus Saganbacteria bacterium]|nr:site-2 protease family protein [Candidatus Saganbacteria bacterium]